MSPSRKARSLIGPTCLAALLVLGAPLQAGDATPGAAAPPPPAGPAPGGAAAPATSPTPPPDPANPDWPCIQHKMPTLTSAQIWDGPPVEDLKGWEGDEKIVELTAYLESRRVPLEDAEKAIKEYAGSLPEGERDKKLTELFASVLARLNADRQFVMGRIEEFQRRQVARAKELEREGQKLAEMNQVIPPEQQLGPMDANLTPEQKLYNWNARIFQERQQNMPLACEIPVLIEQRAYEIGRLIRAEMAS